MNHLVVKEAVPIGTASSFFVIHRHASTKEGHFASSKIYPLVYNYR